MPGLTPTARPVDTYARPQAPQQGNAAMQFASALATINPDLRQLMDDESARQQAEQEAKANRMLGGMTHDQARAALDAGMPEMESEWFKSGFMSQFGERQAHFRINELTELYATDFDVENGDLDALISGKMAEDLEKYGDNKFFVSTYSATMDDFRPNAQQKHIENRSAIAVDKAKGGVFDVFLGTAQQMREAGKTPAEITAALYGRYQGNADILNIPAQDQDTELMRVADVFAQKGDTEMVQAMLNEGRKGADGAALGALSGNRLYAADSARLQVTAENKRNETNQAAAFDANRNFADQALKGVLNPDELATYRAATPGAISDDRAQSLITQSQNELARSQELAATNAARIERENLSIRAQDELRAQNQGLAESGKTPFLKPVQLPDAQGDMKSITVDQQNAWLADDIVTSTQAMVTSGDATPEQAFDMQVERFATAGIENPQWKNVLSAGVSGANAWSISGKDTAPPALVEGAKLYMEMYAKSPQLLNRHIKDLDVSRFYVAYRVAVQRAGMEPDEAYSHAVAVTKLPPIDNPMTAVPKAALETALNAIGDGSGSWFGGGGTANNSAAVAQELMNIASDYTLGGTLTGTAAMEEAAKDYTNTHRSINGQWVDVSDAHIPANFDAMAKAVIEDYAADFGENPAELTIRPSTNGTGAWEIIHTGDWPMPVDDPSRRNVTLEDMSIRLDQHSAAAAVQVGADQAAAQGVAEKARVEDLTAQINSGQTFLDTPSYQQTFANKNGADGLEAELKAVRERITAQQTELDALNYSGALRAVEAQTQPRSPNPLLMK